LIGATLSHFKITALLGRGGMGEVYRATDTRLGREVALKLLPEAFAADAERRSRFEREARVLAALNHPNIATLYGLEALDGEHALLALVMELVEGEGLDERIARGALPVDEVVPIAAQIAAALAAAHDQGILHRDLKPANVRIRPDGTVKVLDFGLAKAWMEDTPAAELAMSPTLTRHGTVDGMILGTAAYMSPEQARGKPLDRRSDLWSFGVVLWEMLTGRALFSGETVTDLLAGVLRAELDLEELPPETPRALRRVVDHCLQRDPKRRWRDAGDLALELAETSVAAEPAAAPASTPAVPASSPRPRWLAPAAILAAFALGAGAVWLAGNAAAPNDPSRPSLSFEPKTYGRQKVFNARFLPDGRGIVYSSALAGNRPEIFLLAPGSQAPQRIAPAGTTVLSVSARGELAILTDTTYSSHRVHEGTLARMTVDGSPRALVDSVRDADWGPDGELAIVHRRAGLDRLEYPPGKVLYETTGYVSEPRVSADGSRVAFLDHPWWIDDRGWVKVVDRAGAVATLTGEYWAIEGLSWAPGGERLFYSGADEVTSNHLQPRSVALAGGPVREELTVPGELMVVDVAPDGRWLAIQEEGFYGIAVRQPGGGKDLDLTWLDLSWGVSTSPDRQSIAFSNGHGGANYAVVTRRLDGSPISTLGEGESLGYSPDGAWFLAKIPTPPELVLYPTGAGAPRRLERGSIDNYETARWFPDGRSLFVTGSEPGRPLRAFRQPIDGGPPVPLTPEGIYGTLSPQGDRVLALDAGAGWKLYPLDGGAPRSVPGLGRLEEIASWSPAGDAVYARRLGEVPMRLARVDLATGARTPSLVVGPADEVGLVRVEMDDRVLDPERTFSYEYLRRLSTLYLVTGAGP